MNIDCNIYDCNKCTDPNGEQLKDDTQCLSKHCCQYDEGVYRCAKLKDGEPSYDIDGCGTLGLYQCCTNLDIGDGCQKDSQCKSNMCSNSKCIENPKKKKGDSCNANSECQSDDCSCSCNCSTASCINPFNKCFGSDCCLAGCQLDCSVKGCSGTCT